MEQIKSYLRKNNETEDWSGDTGIEDEISGNYLSIDLSKSKGTKIKIKSELTFIVDLSGSVFDEVELEGFFVKVDLSQAQIGTLTYPKAEIISFEKWRSKIDKTVK